MKPATKHDMNDEEINDAINVAWAICNAAYELLDDQLWDDHYKMTAPDYESAKTICNATCKAAWDARQVAIDVALANFNLTCKMLCNEARKRK